MLETMAVRRARRRVFARVGRPRDVACRGRPAERCGVLSCVLEALEEGVVARTVRSWRRAIAVWQGITSSVPMASLVRPLHSQPVPQTTKKVSRKRGSPHWILVQKSKVSLTCLVMYCMRVERCDRTYLTVFVHAVCVRACVSTGTARSSNEQARPRRVTSLPRLRRGMRSCSYTVHVTSPGEGARFV